MENADLGVPALDFHRLAKQRKGHRVTVAVEAHEKIGSDHPKRTSIKKLGCPGAREERGVLALEPIQGTLVDRAMDTHIANGGIPFIELGLTFYDIDKGTAG